MAGRWVLERMSAIGLGRADADCSSEFRLLDGHLHGELDAICPRCLRWIEEREFVRRTAYGPLQHEVCPEQLAASS